MSSNLPLRTVRIPALRQQCLFRHRRLPQSPRAFSTTAPQAFASTTPRPRSGQTIGNDRAIAKAGFRYQMGYAPKVQQTKAQEEGAMHEDIGLLQDTMVRASLGKLPSIFSGQFYGYFWKLIKTKATSFYSRIQYNRCLGNNNSTWERWKRVDRFKGGQIKLHAKTLYKQLYLCFVNGDMTPISKHCLPPILKEFETRIAARGPVKMDWRIVKGPKVQIVSHRASLMGQDPQEGAFRQVVVRVTSTQELSIAGGGHVAKRPAATKSKSKVVHSRQWSPHGHTVKPSSQSEDVVDDAAVEYVGGQNGKERKKVVEYMVIQKKYMNGKQDPHWKIWGFTQESTPVSVAQDEEYWRHTLSSQTSAT